MRSEVDPPPGFRAGDPAVSSRRADISHTRAYLECEREGGGRSW